MIHYEAFKALPVAERDAICAEEMGWKRHPNKAIAAWLCDGQAQVPIKGWSPTTDRNDAAMMVETVKGGRLKEQFDDALAVVTDMDDVVWCAIILLDPCLIAYCACVALEGAWRSGRRSS